MSRFASPAQSRPVPQRVSPPSAPNARQSWVPERVLDLFSANPFWTVGALAERLEVAYTTAQGAVNRLEALGAASRIGDERRDRVYCAHWILDVLEDPHNSPDVSS